MQVKAFSIESVLYIFSGFVLHYLVNLSDNAEPFFTNEKYNLDTYITLLTFLVSR